MPLSATLFVSDLHLDETRPRATAQFERFLGAEVPRADALYILGDLFEYWVGDDGLELALAQRIAAALKQAAAAVPTYFMHGNRDFLVAERFSAQTGVQLLEDPARVDLYGTPTVLLHGDTLCTDDAAYQAYRRQVRDPEWQRSTLARPLPERLALAREIRLRSEGAKDGKPREIMDVSAAAVEKAFAESHCTRMIHGHTHRPGRHVHRVDGRECERWVLADWYDERGSYLEVSAAGVRAGELG